MSPLPSPAFSAGDMRIGVKICGITDERALNAAIEAGADYVGFVHYPRSPRHIEPEAIVPWIEKLPNNVIRVSVVVDPDDKLLTRVRKLDKVRRGHMQLHGKDIRKKFPGISTIKAIPVSSAADLTEEKLEPYIKASDFLLFDANPPANGLPGGNAISFDWSLLRNGYIDDETFFSRVPWLLSGGLNAGNVAEAIRQSGAHMVDVSSGVESAPGVKDPKLIEAFIKAARA